MRTHRTSALRCRSTTRHSTRTQRAVRTRLVSIAVSCSACHMSLYAHPARSSYLFGNLLQCLAVPATCPSICTQRAVRTCLAICCSLLQCLPHVTLCEPNVQFILVWLALQCRAVSGNFLQRVPHVTLSTPNAHFVLI
jgi:hypothetical protein